MGFNTIFMGDFSQAYDLDIPECVEIAQKIPCEIKVPPVDADKFIEFVSNLDKYAKQYAQNVFSEQFTLREKVDNSFHILSTAQLLWRNIDTEQSAAEWEKNIGRHLRKGDMKTVLTAFFPISRLFLLTGIEIMDKAAAVRFLHNQHYFLRKEVRGLTKEYVDAITAKPAQPEPQTAEQATAPAAEVSPASEKRKTAPRAEVSRKEAARVLGVSEKTIQRWEKGETQAPQGWKGRGSWISFKAFARQFKQDAKLKQTALGINRATPGGDMDNYSESVEL